MNRITCGGCSSTNLHEVLDLGDSPLANDFPLTAADAATQSRYPLVLGRCYRCSLIQLMEIVPDEELWNSNYGFYISSSWVAVMQQEHYAKSLLDLYWNLAYDFTVEIACNDGSMLNVFKEARCRTLGVDPAIGPATKAQSKGLEVLVQGFGLATAQDIVLNYGQAGLIIANNVIAHVSNLDDFIMGMAHLLRRDGVAVVEFQYAADLITGNQIDQIYHEHRQFFSLTSLSRALARHDLEPVSVLQTSPQGGSLRVTVQHMGMGPADSSVSKLRAEEAWLLDEHALAGLQGRANRIQHLLQDMLLALSKNKKHVAGYGASGKSTTLLNFCGIGPELVQYMVDSTPIKQGRYTPGTGIPIIDPKSDSRMPDVYLLTIHNYAGAVMSRERGLFQGHWLLPIPMPTML